MDRGFKFQALMVICKDSPFGGGWGEVFRSTIDDYFYSESSRMRETG